MKHWIWKGNVLCTYFILFKKNFFHFRFIILQITVINCRALLVEAHP